MKFQFNDDNRNKCIECGKKIEYQEKCVVQTERDYDRGKGKIKKFYICQLCAVSNYQEGELFGRD